MRGSEKVIQHLNDALKSELTAIVQYMIHGEMLSNWGYKRLGSYIKKQAIDEMRHAEGLIERVLFLEGTPRLDVLPTPKIGANVKQQLENDLAGELDAVRDYNASVAACVAEGDDGTRALFEKMVRDEEGHTDWLEGQLVIIEQAGLQNYLAQQIHENG